MRPARRPLVSLVGLLTAFALAAGCGAEGGGSDGTGGQNGTGGTSGQGGSSGATGSGGATGQGGSSGATGSGGASVTGAGGEASGSGGHGGTGGGSGGQAGATASGSGGASSGGSGGQAGAGTGGQAGAGGHAGSGGQTGGATGTGGQAGAGGAGAGHSGVVAAGVRWFGRVDTTNAAMPRFAWSGTGFIAKLSGTGLSVGLSLATSNEPYLFKPVVDGAPQPVFKATASGTFTVASGLSAGTHTVELYRQTEGPEGDSQLTSITVTGGALMTPPAGPARLIEVIGDSITCGYGDLGALADSDCYPTESDWDSYASVAARALGAEVSTICASGRGVVRNYGGDTGGTLPKVYAQTTYLDATPTWDFHIEPDAVVVNLGTNDISNGKGDPGTPFETAYLGLLQTVRAHYPHAYIVCIIGPLLSGSDLTTIEGHIHNVVQTMTSAGDTRVELFDQIQPQPSSAYACQYHPDVTEQTLMGNQLATEIAARVGW
ncbi:MAG TPA: GDSL-type esterase/lipase family protein [Polyangia bacterium]|nr:GDSL-type esterase/lipase family protein [Polyangia bacterium]